MLEFKKSHYYKTTKIRELKFEFGCYRMGCYPNNYIHNCLEENLFFNKKCYLDYISISLFP